MQHVELGYMDKVSSYCEYLHLRIYLFGTIDYMDGFFVNAINVHNVSFPQNVFE